MKFLRVLLVVLATLSVVSVDGKDITSVFPMRKTAQDSVRINDSLVVYTDSTSNSHVDYNIRNLIRLKMEPGMMGTLGDTSISVTLNIRDEKNNITSKTLYINTLQKSSSASYIGEAIYQFDGSSRYALSITGIQVNGQSVQVLPFYISIVGEITADRIIDFVATDAATCSRLIINDCEEGSETIEINWTEIPGAEEYQLEWTFVNDYRAFNENGVLEYLSASQLQYDFKNNSTRISTSENRYQISNIYEHGYLIYRVRGIGRALYFPDQEIFGVWSIPASQASVSSLSNTNNSHYFWNTIPHEGLKNWQYAATFAEEGKKKEVISYFDGSLRNRQSVTKTNTDNTVLVGQTIYDSQGRPAVNVLPVPVSSALQCDNSSTGTNVIKYYNNFNQNENNVPYNYLNFENETAPCTTAADPMSTSSGASNYYSSDNILKERQQAYLPDAGGYPFTQIRYTPDNTGRVTRQSGVGPEFQIGTGQEIANFYGQPEQIQLDRLFGSEAGDASHYKKNLVVDANKQASVSYLNQEGKVVATSLTGEAPFGIVALDGSDQASKSLVVDMFKKNSDGVSESNKVTVDGQSIVFSTQVLVASNTTNYKYDYSLNVSDYKDDCMASHICFSCVYDMQIIIQDECGAIVKDTDGFDTYTDKKFVGRFQTNLNGQVVFDTNCTAPQGNAYTYSHPRIDVNLDRGVYTVSKVLTLNQDILKKYVDFYTDTTKSKCMKKLSEYQDDALAEIDLAGCEISCDICKTALGSREEWVAQNKGTAMEWDRLYEECGAPCKTVSLCESSYEMMLADVSPLGQYAKYVRGSDGVYTYENYSLFNENNPFGGDWRTPKVKINNIEYQTYLDVNGNPAKVELFQNSSGTWLPLCRDGLILEPDADGRVFIIPQDLKYASDFISAWQPSWAKSLVSFHPEYCQYEQCSKYSKEYTEYIRTSDSFDQLLMTINTFKEAIAKNLIKYQNGKYSLSNFGLNEDPNLEYDPYAVDNSLYTGISGESPLYKLFREYKAYDYDDDHEDEFLSMEQVASYTIRYGNHYGHTPSLSDFNEFGQEYVSTQDINEKNDKEWNMAKGFYLSEKRRLQDLSDRSACTAFSFEWIKSIGKEPRFYGKEHMPGGMISSEGGAQREVYYQTGLCPMAYDMMTFLSVMASSEKLTETNVNLELYPEFTERLYNTIEQDNPGYLAMKWSGAESGNELSIDLTKDNQTETKFIKLVKPNDLADWDRIDGFQEFTNVVRESNGSCSFTIKARVENPNEELDPFTYYDITGNTDIDIATCSFPPYPNGMSSNLLNLWNALVANGQFESTSQQNLSLNYTSYLTSDIKNRIKDDINSNCQTYYWKKLIPRTYEISSSCTKKLMMKITSPTNVDLSTAVRFEEYNVSTDGNFTMKAVLSDNSDLQLEGHVYVLNSNNTMEYVGLEAMDLQTEQCTGKPFQLANELSQLLIGVELNVGDFNDVIALKNLAHPPYYTPLISEALDATGCKLVMSTHLTGTFDKIIITGRVMPYGMSDNDGNHSSFYMLANYYVTINNVQRIIKDTIFGTSPCMFINRCSCPIETELDINKWDQAEAFLSCMKPVYSISEQNNVLVIHKIASNLFDCMSNLGIDSTGSWRCLELINNNQECEDCFAKLFMEKSNSLFSASVTATYSNDQELIDAILAGTVERNPFAKAHSVNNISCTGFSTNNAMPGASWYRNNTDNLPYILYQKKFNLTSPISELDLQILPMRQAYVILNGKLIANFVNPDPSESTTLNKFSLYGYGELLHQGENTLQIIIRTSKQCNSVDLGLKGVIRSATPCVSGIPIGGGRPNAYTPIGNPCQDQLVATALNNAQNAYDQQLADLRTEIIEKYTSHCMGSLVENFTGAYVDKEYHFTLYYYDQAGNLVKTIPPAGVDVLDLTGENNIMRNQIIYDRTHNTRSVFTKHRMETRYEYNSLNQLVKQVTPDQDRLDIWEKKLPNGLPDGMIITATQFVNANKGYLTGNVGTRGMMYETNNGGATWSRVNDLVASDLKKVQIIGTTAYAIGSGGVVLKRAIDGISWDMLDTYNSNSPIITDLTDLNFINEDQGVVVGANGKSYYTDDAGATFTAMTALSATTTINAIAYIGSTYYIATSDNGVGAIYTKSGNSWVLQTNSTQSKSLANVEYSSGKWHAVGVQGNLLNSTDGIAWQVVESHTTQKIDDIHFFSDNVCIALIEDQNQKKQLMKSADGGKTWSSLGTTSSRYNMLYMNSANSGFAVGTQGVINQIVYSPTTHTVGTLPVNQPQVNFNSDTYGIHASSDGSCIWLATTNMIYFGSRSISNNQYDFTWNAVSHNATTGYKKCIANYSNATALFLQNGGVVVKAVVQGNNSIVLSTNFASGIADITATTSNIVAVTDIGEVKQTALNPITNFANVTVNTTNISNIVSLASNGNNLTMVGSNGSIYTTTFDDESINWNDHSFNITPLAINDLYVDGANMHAVGDCGSMYKYVSSKWQPISTATNAKLTSVKANSTQTVITGTNGTLAMIENNIVTPIATATNNTLNEVALNSTFNKGYAVGANGTVFYMEKTNNVWNVQPVTGSGTLDLDYNGLLMDGDNAIIVGSRSAIITQAASGSLKSRRIYTPMLKSLSFANTLNGYVVGSEGTIRHTTNGGATWNIVLPSVSPLKVMNIVCATSADHALIGGDAGYVASVSGNTTPQALTFNGLTQSIYTIKSRGANIYFGGAAGKLYKSADGGANWNNLSIATTADIRAIHIFNNNNGCIVAGTQGFVATYDNNSVTLTNKNLDLPAGTQINDIYFHDDRNGYVVGNSGAIYICKPLDHAFIAGTSITWISKTLVDDHGIDQTAAANVNINTIAFPSRYNGFIAGNISNTNTYARMLHDESEMYSTFFWYDRLSRMVVSRNRKQEVNNAYSYTVYDDQGRIEEVGEITESSSTKFNSIFGATIGNLFNPNVIDNGKFNAWIAANTRTQITRTFYDDKLITAAGITQENLRKRVATATYSDTYHSVPTDYDYATHYSYDIHGYVKTLWQDNKKLTGDFEPQRFKRIDYDYDLVSGKVNEVRYQEDQPDQFIHRYKYDDDNRITEVYTSKNGIQFDRDARYYYYLHGPLARVEVGNEMVQGVDYAYTLQGWIKGVNSNSLNENRDMGTDSKAGSANANVARDVFGYTLNYYDEDYNAIDQSKWLDVANRFEAGKQNSDWMSGLHCNLYNGNISSMATTITEPTTRAVMPLGTTYAYDQLNRLREMNSNNRLDFTSNQWVVQGMYSYTKIYQNKYTYDANGNILTLQRRNKQGFVFDNLNYKYQMKDGNPVSNRLYHVNDAVDDGFMPDDIDDQDNVNSLDNYEYDELGNLTSDIAEGIDDIEWTAYGKIKSITRINGYNKTVNGQTVYPSNLEFRYDATGNRIAKIEKPNDVNGNSLNNPNKWITTYYVRDATGNPMGTYIQSAPNSATSYKLIERPIYGSSRVGIDNTELELFGYTAPTSGILANVLGNKQYEFSNHLGNVLTTVTDKKIPVDVGNDGTIDWYVADITSASDYYPFGSPMDGRTFSSEKYRFGFNTQEKVDEISGEGNHNTALFWEYDNRLGRRWNLDPKPQICISDYAVMGDNPIFNMDWLGDIFGEKGNTESQQDNKKQADEMKSDFKTKENEFNETAKSLKNSMSIIKNKNSREYRNLRAQYNEAIKGAREMKQGQLEIDRMANDQKNYFVFREVDFAGSISAKKNSDGSNTNTVYLNYKKGNYFAKVHETKHGFQVTKGLATPDYAERNITPIGETRNFFSTNNKILEVQAYYRQFFFDNVSLPLSNGRSISSSLQITINYIKSLGY